MDEWASLTGAPLAPLVGPFPHRPFLEAWRNHRPAGDLAIVAVGGSSAAIISSEDGIRFAGETHLTDYHSPLGSDPAGLAETVLGMGRPILFDSLPAEAADPLERSLMGAGAAVERSHDEACFVLDLEPHPGDDWVAILPAKERHEVRRKRRRFADTFGSATLQRDAQEFDRFVELHRQSPGTKGGFMGDDMARLFSDLLTLEGARLDVLRAGDGLVVAAAFGFEDDEAYYLYNSAFDPAAAAASPGIVLVDHLIGQAASDGRPRFDFLKGDEVYKRRLGAVARPLFRLEVA